MATDNWSVKGSLSSLSWNMIIQNISQQFDGWS